MEECFSVFMLLQQNTTDWAAYKQGISHSSGGWTPKVRVPVWVRDLFWISGIFTVSSQGGGEGTL